MQTIFLLTFAGFLAGAFVGFGGYFFGRKTINDAVAEVNGKNIPYRKFIFLVNRTMENIRKNENITEERLKQIKQEVLQDIVQQEVFWQEAKKYGITVSDAEVAADIQHYPAFQKDGQFNRQLYFQTLYQILKTTPEEFEESRRKQIAIFKLRYLISTSIIFTEPEIRLEYAKANKGSMKDYEKERNKFLESLRQKKTLMVFNEWFKYLNQTTKIEVHLNEIEKS